MSRSTRYRKLADIIILTMLGVLIFVLKKCTEALPNIHPVTMLIAASTIVYRKKALIAVYVYVFLDGLFLGFAVSWIPYLYIWTLLWAAIMLVPRRLKPKTAVPVYALVCGLFGLLFGTLYAPAQALLFHLNFKATLLWIAAGLPFDAIHAVSNFATGLLAVPIAETIKLFYKKARLS